MKHTMEFGIAKDLITPCIRTTLMGFGSVWGQPFVNIHDDLYVRTLLLKDPAGSHLLLISLDLCFHDDSLTEALRDFAAEKYSVSRNNLLVIYTHTHFGPSVKGYDLVFHDPDYEAFLFERVCQCIDRAYLNQYQGNIEYGSVSGNWNMSRRKKKEDGENCSVSFAPTLTGDRDPHLYLLKLSDVDGNIKALLVNFACHPSNANEFLNISSEYPGRLCHVLEQRFYGATALFFQGSGADAKLSIGASAERFVPVGYEEINEVALSMAERLHTLILKGDMVQVQLSLDARMFKFNAPLEVYPKEFFKKEADRYSGMPGVKFDVTRIEEANSPLHWFCADYVVDHYDEMPDSLPVNCGLIRLSDTLYIATVGGEPSHDVKRVIQDALPNKYILFFGYNDAIAYIPSDKLIAEGGYEADGSVVEYRLKGRIAPGIDRLFIDNFQKAEREMTESYSSLT